MTKSSCQLLGAALLTGAMLVSGCSSATPPTTGDGCVESGSAALKTCAKATTVRGVDVSSYQGAVDFAKVKAAGNDFAFARISDGLDSIDSSFPSDWPAMKTAGIVRGAYQYFRPSQDAGLQAQLVIDKLNAHGGLQPGDLPPVLDLETSDGVSASTVVLKAQKWLTNIEAATGVRPIVYTAAFMSDVIGTSFGGYTLWVANYGTTCPTMPSGWTNWQFWQDDDSGSVSGIDGATDTDFFNGTLAQLKALTVPAATPGTPNPFPDGVDEKVGPAALAVAPGSQGATIGSSTPSAQTNGATITPCQ